MAQTFIRSYRTLALLGGCAGLLCGCHKPPAPPPPSPAAVVAAPPKPNDVLPARQPGLWQTTVAEQGSEDQPQVLQICMDALTDQHLGVLGTDLSGDACTKKTISKMPDGSWGILAECDMGTGGVNEFSGSISGDYTSDYTMKLRSQTTGASLPQMNHVTTYTVASKRTGDCAADQKPGDIITGGTKLNLFDMAGIKTAAQRSQKASQSAQSDVSPNAQGGDE